MTVTVTDWYMCQSNPPPSVTARSVSPSKQALLDQENLDKKRKMNMAANQHLKAGSQKAGGKVGDVIGHCVTGY